MATALEIDLLINAAQGANTLKDVKSSLKAIKDAMLSVGEDSKEFTKLARSAENLKGKLDDVNDRIRAVDPDGFAALTNFAGKAAGAVSLVSGAMALLGTESEDVQKALMKVQAAMALSQGLDSIKGMVKAYKDLASLIKATTIWQNIMNALEKQSIALKAAQAQATVGQAVATEGATIAQKALNIAMKANPLGLIIIAITALVAVFVTLNEVMGGASDETLKLNAELEKQKKITSALIAQYENEIIVLEAMGNQEEKIYELKKQMMLQQIHELELSVEVHKSKVRGIKDNDSLYESLLKIADATGMNAYGEELAAQNKKERAAEELKALEDETAQIATLKAQLTALDINEEKRIVDATQDKLDKEKEAADKKLADSKKSAEEQNRINQELHDADIKRLIALGQREEKARQDKLAAELYLAEQLEQIRLAGVERRETQEAAEKAQRDEFFALFPEAMRKQEETSLEFVKRLLDEGRISFLEYSTAIVAIQQDTDEKRRNSQLQFAEATISILANLSSLAKQGSNAQKALALSQIAADTAVGFIKGLVVAQTAAAATGPGAAFAFPIFYASQIAAVLGAAKKAKDALSGGSGGGGASGSSSMGASLGSGGIAAINTAPAQPQAPTTQLGQNGNVTGQNGQQNSIRVFVVESDITNSQNNVSVVQSAVAHR